jgi:hypothetical protein
VRTASSGHNRHWSERSPQWEFCSLERRVYPLRPVIGVPQFCGQEQFFTVNPSSGKSCLQRFAHFALIPTPPLRPPEHMDKATPRYENLGSVPLNGAHFRPDRVREAFQNGP